MILTRGLRRIRQYMAKQYPDIAKSIVVGIGETAVALDDLHLDFQVARVPVAVISADFVNDKIIFKGTLPAELEATIYELGLFSTETEDPTSPSRVLADFSEAWDAGTLVTLDEDSNRLGAESLEVTATASTTTTASLADLIEDLSRYPSFTKIKLALEATANVASVEIIFYTDAVEASYTISTPAAGYDVYTLTKGDLVDDGVDFANITKYAVKVTATSGGSATVRFDGLRIDVVDPLDDEYVLVSRKLLTTPIRKSAGIPMDVEVSIPAPEA